MTIERPMFPPRAESVDSFSHQAAIGQRERECRVSESRKPAEGLSRRMALASLAMLPVAQTVIGIPMATAAADRDPAFALISKCCSAQQAPGRVQVTHRRWSEEYAHVPVSQPRGIAGS
jgi:hypothetical protein